MNSREQGNNGRSSAEMAAEPAADAGLQIVEEIAAARSCCIVDDVVWSDERGRFEGSFLWHGTPATVRSLRAFAEFAAAAGARPDVVAGISSSGIAWATAAALRIDRPLGVLRLARHRYGVHNGDLARHRGGRAWLIDNFVGSGETLRDAHEALRDLGIEVACTIVVEAPEASPVSAALRTEAKLRELVRRGFFTPLGREIVERSLTHPRRGLDDVRWVEQVKARLRENESER